MLNYGKTRSKNAKDSFKKAWKKTNKMHKVVP
jgi:hypothetical protein